MKSEACYAQQVRDWLRKDATRMALLKETAALALPDWCLAAGFVRNLVWDRLHGYSKASPLNDIDVIYFDASQTCESRDQAYEDRLRDKIPVPWSVKNQARMHIRNGDRPYHSSVDALSYWVELETAVGVRLAKGRVEFIAPFGLAPLFSGTITLNAKCRNPQAFTRRVERKNWRETWPNLQVVKEHGISSI
ncbi:nucleotidyltransferase family protein [Gilvimarinus japonicus]